MYTDAIPSFPVCGRSLVNGFIRKRSKVVIGMLKAAILGGVLRVNPSPGTAKGAILSTSF